MPLNHTSTVIAEPERFGLSREEIQLVYDKYGEPLALEGQARREILLRIILQGWIRLRRYPNRYWSVTAERFAPAVQELLHGWAANMLAGAKDFKEPDRYMPVKVSTVEEEYLCSIGDLSDCCYFRCDR